MKYILLIILISIATGCNDKNKNNEISENEISLSKAMSEDKNEKFDKATDKIKFKFPEDHGPHPGFKTEWWYFTGNLTDKDNKKFGYQFTIFRSALNKDTIVGNSDWRSNQIYMAHFTVTDISGNEFYFEERFSRTGNELAGAKINPFKVWVEDWEIQETGENTINDLPVLNIKAKTENAEINFRIESHKPLVLQGDSGLSQKGKQAGNASYYYSYTRMKTEGKIFLEDKEFNVSGTSWMDHEWSTSALSGDQKGWDWFAFQLDDSTDLMYYQLRKDDGSPDIYSKGILVGKDGKSETLNKEEVDIDIRNYWESPGGVKYPSGWNLNIPSKNIFLKITPAVSNQLLDVSIKYWEGAVKIEGTKDNSKISGRGYVELTGY